MTKWREKWNCALKAKEIAWPYSLYSPWVGSIQIQSEERWRSVEKQKKLRNATDWLKFNFDTNHIHLGLHSLTESEIVEKPKQDRNSVRWCASLNRGLYWLVRWSWIILFWVLSWLDWFNISRLKVLWDIWFRVVWFNISQLKVLWDIHLDPSTIIRLNTGLI